MRKAIFLIIIAIALTGCGDYWTARGDAARRGAEAALARAQAEQEAAEATILEAQGSLALDRAQAGAISDLAKSNSEILEETVRLAKRDPNAGLMAVVLVMAALFVAAAMAIAVAALRRPAAPVVAPPPASQVIDVDPISRMRIETPQGVIALEQDPGETRYMFLLRARETAELMGGGRLLGPGK